MVWVMIPHESHAVIAACALQIHLTRNDHSINCSTIRDSWDSTASMTHYERGNDVQEQARNRSTNAMAGNPVSRLIFQSFAIITCSSVEDARTANEFRRPWAQHSHGSSGRCPRKQGQLCGVLRGWRGCYFEHCPVDPLIDCWVVGLSG